MDNLKRSVRLLEKECTRSMEEQTSAPCSEPNAQAKPKLVQDAKTNLTQRMNKLTTKMRALSEDMVTVKAAVDNVKEGCVERSIKSTISRGTFDEVRAAMKMGFPPLDDGAEK